MRPSPHENHIISPAKLAPLMTRFGALISPLLGVPIIYHRGHENPPKLEIHFEQLNNIGFSLIIKLTIEPATPHQQPLATS